MYAVRACIDQLIENSKKLQTQLTNTKNAIRNLQAICDHEMQYSWHDSHHNYFVCKHCLYEESR